MDVKDLILACSGKSESGNPKCMFTLFNEVWGMDDSKTTIDDLFIDKPELRIFKHAGYVQVDFIYESARDMDLYFQHKFIEDFSQSENSVDYTEEELEKGIYIDENGYEKPVKFPNLILNIIPRELKEKYYIMGFNPIFSCLQPLEPEGEIKMIRLVFNEEDFLFLEADSENLNVGDIEQEAIAEADEETLSNS